MLANGAKDVNIMASARIIGDKMQDEEKELQAILKTGGCLVHALEEKLDEAFEIIQKIGIQNEQVTQAVETFLNDLLELGSSRCYKNEWRELSREEINKHCRKG